MRPSACSSSGPRLPSRSRWVRGEAREAADRGILVPVRFEEARLPMDVRALHTTDLDHWGNDPASPPFQEVLRALSSMIARNGAPQAGKSRARFRAAASAAKADPRFDLRPAIRQHERRRGAGVLQRRHQRGHHHRPQQGLVARRGLAQHGIQFQGQERRHSPDREAAQGQLRAGRQRPQGGRPRPHHRPADRGVEGQPGLGRALRPRPERHLRAPGRDLRGHRQGAQAADPAGRKEGDRAARHDQPRGLQPLPDGAAIQRHRQLRQRPPLRGHHPPVPQRDGDRPELRDGLGADGRRAGRPQVLFQRAGRWRPGSGRAGALAGRESRRGARRESQGPDGREPVRQGARRNRGRPAPGPRVVRGQHGGGAAVFHAAPVRRTRSSSTKRRRR